MDIFFDQNIFEWIKILDVKFKQTQYFVSEIVV